MPITNLTQQAKDDLIQNVIFSVSKNAAFQRNKIYGKEKLSPNDSKIFKVYLKCKLTGILAEIASHLNYTDEEHYKTITRFAEEISHDYRLWLKDGLLHIGTAQKLINVFWKMSWLLQKDVPTPLHCPFDGIIIKNLDSSVNKMKWTNMTSISDYKLLVAATKSKLKGESIAHWELINYNNWNGVTV